MIFRAVPIVLAFVVAEPTVADEPYSTRPVTLVVSFPPGGIADLTARPLAAALGCAVKHPVVVTNKAGAAGAVRMQSAAIVKLGSDTLNAEAGQHLDDHRGRRPVRTRPRRRGGRLG